MSNPTDAITPSTPWALINRPVDDLRRGPATLTERVTQARLGEVARILESGPEWSRIRLEHDGYPGWIHTRALHPCSAEAAAHWTASLDAVVSAGFAEVRDEAGKPFQKLVFATRVALAGTDGGSSLVRLPDGRRWRVRSEDLLDRAAAPKMDAAGIALTLELCQRFLGVPYLWGGRTPYGFDCSGFASTFYGFMGLDIPRDADQQFAAGEPVTGTLLPGDLLYFGEVPADGVAVPDARGYVRQAHISHAGISLGGTEFIHASGNNWGIARGTLDPESPLREPWLMDNYRGARRFRP